VGLHRPRVLPVNRRGSRPAHALVYEHVLRMNAGFDQAIRSLRALRKHSGFHGGMLARFTALSKETRAEANSYLASVIESSETKEAGSRFRKRKAQERADEQG